MSQRQPRLYDPGYLAFLRTRPCMICGTRQGVEAAHIRFGLTGMGRKPDDSKALPLCAWDHRNGPHAQHKTGDEQAWWQEKGIDPLRAAAVYYAEYGGDGGRPKKPRKIKPRKPAFMRKKIQGRGFAPVVFAERTR